MNRLGIFSFYDRDGIVDLYIEYLLEDLKKNLKYLIIVVNGKVNGIGKKILDKYADLLLIRENKGFDGGAYKDVLVNILGEDKIKSWDEVVLCNDTFYGPFIPFEMIFKEMENQDIDFWGLNYISMGFLSHIQSYFLVFRINPCLSRDLIEYFENNIDSGTEIFQEILASFENGLFLYLVRKEYKYSAYTQINTCNIYRNPDIFIKKYKLPILKKRSFSPSDFDENSLMGALNYISLKFDYKLSLILNNACRLYDISIDVDKIENSIYTIDEKAEKQPNKCIVDDEILKFINKYEEVYIYGTGFYAKKIWYLYHNYIKKFKGFIISDDQVDENRELFDYPVIHYNEVKGGRAIILGIKYDNSKVVIPNLKTEDNILFIWRR